MSEFTRLVVETRMWRILAFLLVYAFGARPATALAALSALAAGERRAAAEGARHAARGARAPPAEAHGAQLAALPLSWPPRRPARRAWAPPTTAARLHSVLAPPPPQAWRRSSRWCPRS